MRLETHLAVVTLISTALALVLVQSAPAPNCAHGELDAPHDTSSPPSPKDEQARQEEASQPTDTTSDGGGGGGDGPVTLSPETNTQPGSSNDPGSAGQPGGEGSSSGVSPAPGAEGAPQGADNPASSSAEPGGETPADGTQQPGTEPGTAASSAPSPAQKSDSSGDSASAEKELDSTIEDIEPVSPTQQPSPSQGSGTFEVSDPAEQGPGGENPDQGSSQQSTTPEGSPEGSPADTEEPSAHNRQGPQLIAENGSVEGEDGAAPGQQPSGDDSLGNEDDGLGSDEFNDDSLDDGDIMGASPQDFGSGSGSSNRNPCKSGHGRGCVHLIQSNIIYGPVDIPNLLKKLSRTAKQVVIAVNGMKVPGTLFGPLRNKNRKKIAAKLAPLRLGSAIQAGVPLGGLKPGKKNRKLAIVKKFLAAIFSANCKALNLC